jgi:hypothetical protein
MKKKLPKHKKLLSPALGFIGTSLVKILAMGILGGISNLISHHFIENHEVNAAIALVVTGAAAAVKTSK